MGRVCQRTPGVRCAPHPAPASTPQPAPSRTRCSPGAAVGARLAGRHLCSSPGRPRACASHAETYRTRRAAPRSRVRALKGRPAVRPQALGGGGGQGRSGESWPPPGAPGDPSLGPGNLWAKPARARGAPGPLGEAEGEAAACRTPPRWKGMEGQALGDPRPALTLQPLLLEPGGGVARIRPLQGLAGHVQRGLRPVELGQLVREVHGVRPLQPAPRDAAAIHQRIPQLVSEALQLLLAEVLQRIVKQLARSSGAGLHAADKRVSGQVSTWAGSGNLPNPPHPGPGVPVPVIGRGSDAQGSPRVAPGRHCARR